MGPFTHPRYHSFDQFGWGCLNQDKMTITPLQRAHFSLKGLSVGDAFGERYFIRGDLVEQFIEARAVPDPPWRFTDDTNMAISIVEVLAEHGEPTRMRLPRALYVASTHRADMGLEWSGCSTTAARAERGESWPAIIRRQGLLREWLSDAGGADWRLFFRQPGQSNRIGCAIFTGYSYSHRSGCGRHCRCHRRCPCTSTGRRG